MQLGLRNYIMTTEISPIIDHDEAFSEQGCGAGTENACFALNRNAAGEMECMMLKEGRSADMAGIVLGWRVNVDFSDGQTWCPKGVLGSSKIYTPPTDQLKT